MKFFLFVALVALCVLVECKKSSATGAAEAEQSTATKEKSKSKEEKKEKQRDLEYNVKRCPVGWYRFENEKCFRYFPDLGSYI